MRPPLPLPPALRLGSFYIYDRPLTGINVVAGFCAYNVRIKFLIFSVSKQWLLQQGETEVSFVCIIHILQDDVVFQIMWKFFVISI